MWLAPQVIERQFRKRLMISGWRVAASAERCLRLTRSKSDIVRHVCINAKATPATLEFTRLIILCNEIYHIEINQFEEVQHTVSRRASTGNVTMQTVSKRHRRRCAIERVHTQTRTEFLIIISNDDGMQFDRVHPSTHTPTQLDFDWATRWNGEQITEECTIRREEKRCEMLAAARNQERTDEITITKRKIRNTCSRSWV